MQQNIPTGPNYDQQPALPSYAEAIRVAPPPTNLRYTHNFNGNETYQPTAPVYGLTPQSIHIQYPDQSNCNQTIYPPAMVGSYPPTYTTNAHPQYGPTSDDSGLAPTTIHIIRPISTEPATCCSGRSGGVLAIVLSIVILGAIFRVTMNSYF